VVDPTLPIVTFRWKNLPADSKELIAVHEEIVQEMTRDGQLWISDTIVRGRSALRMMVISYLTEERHLCSLEDRLDTVAARFSAPGA
jgi:glutamate/tyrosine decarboxylase-like PLP-dependent enzyme